MTESFEIELRDVRLYGHHGVFEQERRVGNEFVVDVRVTIPVSEGARADRLEGTISYADMYECVREEMSRPSELLEHVAVRIGEALLSRWSFIEEGEVRIRKCTPPIPGFAGTASVKYRFSQSIDT